MNREETRECLLRLPANYCDLPDPFQVSRFFADPRLFPKNTAVVTNPSRGALPFTALD